MTKTIKKTLDFHGRELSLETGKLAPKADASVLVRYGDTMVLVTVATAPSEKAEDFLPLRKALCGWNYQIFQIHEARRPSN